MMLAKAFHLTISIVQTPLPPLKAGEHLDP